MTLGLAVSGRNSGTIRKERSVVVFTGLVLVLVVVAVVAVVAVVVVVVVLLWLWFLLFK